jgi:SNF2 family DNA or RNA helicase
MGAGLTTHVRPQGERVSPKPYQHQLDILELSKDREAYALLLQQGTGKSRIIIDTAAHLYRTGHIGVSMVIAPNGVHRNWITEIERHWPGRLDDCYIVPWSSTPRKAERERLEGIRTAISEHKLIWMLYNVEAFSSTKAPAHAKMLLWASPGLVVVDESSRIKTPGAKRTKSVLRLAKIARFRRILTGTPITQGPLDLYAPFKFLDPNILKFTTYAAFTHHYAIMRRIPQPMARRGYIEVPAKWQRLDDLARRIAPHSSRVTKDQCLDLPPKIYQTRPVDLSPEARRIYNDLRDRYRAEFNTDPDDDARAFVTSARVKATNRLSQLMRLAQVTGGFVRDEAGQVVAIMPNAKLTALMDLLEELDTTSRGTIIWARFIPEIEALVSRLKGVQKVVTYYGATSQDDRDLARQRFQDGDVKIFIANPAVAGLGLTLTAADTMIYFSNSFNAEDRWQSEDRAHRIGQHYNLTIIDLVATNTVDEAVRRALLTKAETADAVLNNLATSISQ